MIHNLALSHSNQLADQTFDFSVVIDQFHLGWTLFFCVLTQSHVLFFDEFNFNRGISHYFNLVLQHFCLFRFKKKQFLKYVPVPVHSK